MLRVMRRKGVSVTVVVVVVVAQRCIKYGQILNRV